MFETGNDEVAIRVLLQVLCTERKKQSRDPESWFFSVLFDFFFKFGCLSTIIENKEQRDYEIKREREREYI